MSPYVTTPSVHRTPCCPGVTQMVQGIKVCTVRCTEASCLYVRSCESSSSWRAAASSDAIEDLPTPEGPQRRISCPAAPPLAGVDASAMGGQHSALREQRRKRRSPPSTHILFWHFSQNTCKTNSEQTNIVPVRQHRRQNGPVVVAVSRLEVTYLL